MHASWRGGAGIERATKGELGWVLVVGSLEFVGSGVSVLGFWERGAA